MNKSDDYSASEHRDARIAVFAIFLSVSTLVVYVLYQAVFHPIG